MNPQIALMGISQVSSTLLGMLIVVALLEAVIFVVGKYILKRKNTIVFMLIAPALIGLLVLIVYPILYELVLSFSNMNLRHFKNPSFSFENGLANFVRVFTKPVLKQEMFLPVFIRTIIWTMQVFVHVAGGILLALLLNRKGLKLKNLYKGILILPWAMPQVIAALTWRGEFNFQYGFFNIILTRMGFEAVQWKAAALPNFIAMIMTNVWLGVPFMMVISLGALQSISSEYYEAADIDGASGTMKLFNITLPLMKPVLAPAAMLGIIWTFNNFNIPYFINEMRLESSEILITALFRAAFNYNQYGFSAAFAIVIFAILFSMTLIYVRATGALKGVTQ